MLKGAASTFAKAQVALAKIAITYPGWRSRLKVAGCLAAVTVVSFLYFFCDATIYCYLLCTAPYRQFLHYPNPKKGLSDD